MTFASKYEVFQQAERRQANDFHPLYWKGDVLMCSDCDGPVAEKHPDGAQDVCPTLERFLADQVTA